MMGRYGRFWIPSWKKDIIITAAFTELDTTLTIQEDQYTAIWFDSLSTGHFLFFEWPDGTWECKEVVYALSSTSIILESALGKACAADELSNLRVSFLYFVRFDQDEIEFEYQTEEDTDIYLSFRTLPYEAYWSDVIPVDPVDPDPEDACSFRSPEEVGPNGWAAITILDSRFTGTIAWSVTGTGFWFGAWGAYKEIETNRRTVVLYADATACGSATITATNEDGVVCTTHIRSTEGHWESICVSNADLSFWAPAPYPCTGAIGCEVIGDDPAFSYKIYIEKEKMWIVSNGMCLCERTPSGPGKKPLHRRFATLTWSPTP